MTTDISTGVRETIADHFGLEMAQVTPETRIIDDLGADSFDGIELLMAIEEKLGCETNESDADWCRTVDDFIYVASRSMGSVKYMTAGG